MSVFKKPNFKDQEEQRYLVIGHVNESAILTDTATGEKYFAMLDENQAPVGTFVESELKHPLKDLPEPIYKIACEMY